MPMSLFRQADPRRAMRDLAGLLPRERYQIWFALISLGLTALVTYYFWTGWKVDRPYRRDIIYVQDWRLDRSDEEIKRQQVIDQAAKERRLAELKRQQDARRAEFKKVDDQLRRWGI